jgi:hypothetical protein
MEGYAPRPAKRELPFKGRVFRHCFGVQPHSLPLEAKGKKDLPSFLNNAFIKDVSEQYLHNSSLYIKVDKGDKKHNFLYLCTFGFKDWIPVAWTGWNEGTFAFHFVERGMLYLPAYYINGKVMPVGAPCSVNADGSYSYIPFVEGTRQVRKVYRKYLAQAIWEKYNKRILNGKLQVSNDPDFKNAVTLHTFTQESNMSWGAAEVTDTLSYRYARYLSGDSGYCNMAEVEFYAQNGDRLRGRVTGTEGSRKNNEKKTKYAVFDGDPLTFFDANEGNGAWAGLDFGQPQKLSKIRYLFRNDDNKIRPGDTYELFYWDNASWVSLGLKVAQDGEEALEFSNCPEQALFWLHNHTRGNEERPFLYVDNKQVFWGKPM